ANSDQRVEPDLVISGDDIVRAILPRAVGHAEIERVALARGAQDGAAEAQEIAGKVGQMQLLAAHRARHEAPGAFMNSKDLPAITKDGPVDHRADDGIQAGAVAATRQDADSLDVSVHPETPSSTSDFSLTKPHKIC